jgi:hypothetical protein
MTNKTTLTSRMNMPRTDMAMLKDVVLRYVSKLMQNEGHLPLETYYWLHTSGVLMGR